MVEGAEEIKIFGQKLSVRAEVESMEFLSAHADRLEMLRWLQQMPVAPRHTWVTHGEPDAADQFRQFINDELQWPATVPYMGQCVEL